eukprot:3748577-Rhodomonas_salina.1
MNKAMNSRDSRLSVEPESAKLRAESQRCRVLSVERRDQVTLDAYPDEVCWTTSHLQAFLPAVLLTAFNLFALPSYLLFRLSILYIRYFKCEALSREPGP